MPDFVLLVYELVYHEGVWRVGVVRTVAEARKLCMNIWADEFYIEALNLETLEVIRLAECKVLGVTANDKPRLSPWDVFASDEAIRLWGDVQ